MKLAYTSITGAPIPSVPNGDTLAENLAGTKQIQGFVHLQIAT
jgi:hypothetical protein